MRIHEQNEVLKEQVKILIGGIKDIKTYLNSPKFYEDNSVNVKDILNRFAEIQNNYNDLPELIQVS